MTATELPALASVIVPTHERPDSLRRCLKSLGGQDYPPGRFEVVVVDDGGTSVQGARAAVGSAVPLTVVQQPRGGPAAARNLGASAAGGQVLAFTDDDCVPERDWLRRLVRRCSSAAGVGAGGRVVNLIADEPYARIAQAVVDVSLGIANADPARARFLTSNNLAFPAEGFRAIGGFDPAFRTAEDRDICDRWNAAGMRLVWAVDAVVGHARPMGGRTFCQVHFGYGRGAYRFHRARAERAGRRRIGSSFIDPLYYREVARLPLAARGVAEAATTAALLGLWHGANVAGFAAEWADGRRDQVRPATARAPGGNLSDAPGSRQPVGRSAG